MPWPVQVMLADRLIASVNDHDVLVAKTRDMGVSWLAVALLLHQWLFEPASMLLMVSRNEAYVDDSGNPKSLFWKLDFMLRRLPSWMIPAHVRTHMHLRNLENGSVIDGESTTGDVARGDRRAVILLDEFAAVSPDRQRGVLASTSQSTHCRWLVSTFSEEPDAFEQKSRDGSCEVHRIGWWDHPAKSLGMVVRPDGTRTSPWYERECRRIGEPRQIARELDCDPQAGGARFFDPALVRRHADLHARPPLLTAAMVIDRARAELVRLDARPNGALRLWCPLSSDGSPAIAGPAAVGVDLSEGTGATPSVASVIDHATGEKIAELATPHERPERFAESVLALLRWMRRADDCLVCPERQGPGRTFIARLHELGFHRFWRAAGAKDDGWNPDKTSRREAYTLLAEALAKPTILNRSREALDEYAEVSFRSDGWIVHRLAMTGADPSGARYSHADRVTADALAVLARTQLSIGAPPRVHDPDSFAARFEARRAEFRRRLRNGEIDLPAGARIEA